MSTTEAPVGKCSTCSAHLVLSLLECHKNEETKPLLPALVHLNAPIVLLGRQSAKVDVPITSKRYPFLTSRVHARLQMNTKGENGIPNWELKDLRSLNGVLVNQMVIDIHILKEGDIIHFGGNQSKKVGEKIANPQTDIRYAFHINPHFQANCGKRKREESSDDPKIKRSAPYSADKEKEKIMLSLKDDEIAEKVKELQATKESLQNLRDTFHADLVQRDNELSNKDEENKSLRAMVEENLKKKEMSDLEEELVCVICSELFVEPFTLSCSHTMCGDCLDKWTRVKTECPFCRSRIVAAPFFSRTLDVIVKKMVIALPEEQKAEHAEMVRKRKEAKDQKVAHLKNMIQRANLQGSRFLSIKAPWKPQERQIFLKGVSNYTESARAVYCSTTGLTQQLINTTTLPTLRIIFRNLALEIDNAKRSKFPTETAYFRAEMTTYLQKRFSAL